MYWFGGPFRLDAEGVRLLPEGEGSEGLRGSGAIGPDRPSSLRGKVCDRVGDGIGLNDCGPGPVPY
jgi:hypothetical protein